MGQYKENGLSVPPQTKQAGFKCPWFVMCNKLLYDGVIIRFMTGQRQQPQKASRHLFATVQYVMLVIKPVYDILYMKFYSLTKLKGFERTGTRLHVSLRSAVIVQVMVRQYSVVFKLLYILGMCMAEKFVQNLFGYILFYTQNILI